MALEPGQGDGFKSEINVTPLVDVMLVLLIIFMLITPFLQPGLAVDLPPARNITLRSDDPDRALTVTISASGAVYVGGTEVEAVALARLLSREHDARPDVELHLKADRNARYGLVRQVVRAGRDAGFADVALVAEKVDAPPASVREDRP